jgi:major membrane immunogen (membrane-anchored lipoprotein)
MVNKVSVVLLAVFLCVSCGGNGNTLKDGYYTAEASEFDSHGWKEYVTVCVSSGRISLIEYNAFNASGFLKSWDMDYMRVMNRNDGTYPNAYTRYYAAQALKNQGTSGVDVLTGATNSYHSFVSLLDAVLENARQGIEDTRLVGIVDAGQDSETP